MLDKSEDVTVIWESDEHFIEKPFINIYSPEMHMFHSSSSSEHK